MKDKKGEMLSYIETYDTQVKEMKKKEKTQIKNRGNNRKFNVWGKQMKQKAANFWKDESGMGVIEVVLIILVLVGLALIFKTQITNIANSIFESITNQVNSF